MQSAPLELKLIRSERTVRIVWGESDVRTYPIRDLRCACSCAACVDEFTGKRILDPSSIGNDILIDKMELVGNYAIRFEFSDGHETGIYTWTKLASWDQPVGGE